MIPTLYMYMYISYFNSLQGHPYDCFEHGLMQMYIYIHTCMFVSHTCMYVAKEVASLING